jgi:tRNA threonylcarbamoyladenosine biosynthesis protein TsaB
VLVLALETSALGGSVALLECDNMLSQRRLAEGRRSGQWLAPAIDEVLREQGREPHEIGLVAVTTGPGSFTGLRVGVTTAKTLAYAVGADVLGVHTLDVIAAQVPPSLGGNGAEIHVVMDAQRKELFVARYHLHEGGGPLRIAADAIVPVEAWLNTLAPGTVVSGHGLDKLESRLPAGVVAVELALREPQAATVGRLAWRAHQAGRRDDLWKLAPVYLRLSYAEEKASGRREPPDGAA